MPIVGRQQELDAIQGVLDSAKSGDVRVVAVTGESGIGKSSLLSAGAQAAELDGWTTASARGVAAAGAPPFSAWRQILRALGENDFPLSPPDIGGRDSVDTAARYRWFDQVLELVAAVSGSAPVVLMFDDLDEADEASIGLLQYLSAQISNTPLILFFGYEPDAGRTDLSRLIADVGAVHPITNISLKGVDESAARHLIQSTIGEPVSDEIVSAAMSRTDGNPFYLQQLAELAKERSGEDAATSVAVWTAGIPDAIANTTALRFSALSADAQDVLSIASLVGSPFTLQQLSACVPEMDVPRKLTALDEAIERGIVVSIGAGDNEFQFNHRLTQEAVASHLPLSRRVVLSAQIAEALERAAGDSAPSIAPELCERFRVAMPILGPDKFVEYARLSGDESLRSHAYEDAIGRFGNALEARSATAGDHIQAELLFKLAIAEFALAGTADERRSAFNHQRESFNIFRANDLPDRAVEVASFGMAPLADAPWFVDLYREALELVDEGSESHRRIQCRLALALGITQNDHQGAERVLSAVASKPDEAALCEMLAARGSITGFWHMQDREGLEFSLEAIDRSERVGDETSRIRAMSDVTSLMIRQADPRVWEMCETFLGEATSLGDRTMITIAHIGSSMLGLLSGDLDSAVFHTDRGLGVAPDSTQLSAIRSFALLERGDVENGALAIDRLANLAVEKTRSQILDSATIAAALAFANYRYGVAEHRSLAVALANRVIEDPLSPPVARVSALTALLLDEGEELTDVRGQEASAHLGQRRRTLLPFLPVSGGEVVAKFGTDAEAVAGILDMFEPAGFELAGAWCATTAYRHGAGDRKLLEGAADIAERCGSVALAEAVAEVGSGTRGRNPAGLSDREVEVLSLLAAGQSNAEIAESLFLSPHTAIRHVSNIYAKIDAANRAEATAFAVRNGLDSQIAG